MRDSISSCTKAAKVIKALLVLGLIPLATSCNNAPPPPLIKVQVFQDWQLKPGDRLAGYAVTGGLGDITIDVQGQAIYAPFKGETQRDAQGCLFYSSPEVPSYLFRLCGMTGRAWFGLDIPPLNRLRLGAVKPGEILGYATTLQFATLRKQTNGKWAIVEPDKSLIETLLKPPPG
jgi:hypothetical protein